MAETPIGENPRPLGKDSKARELAHKLVEELVGGEIKWEEVREDNVMVQTARDIAMRETLFLVEVAVWNKTLRERILRVSTSDPQNPPIRHPVTND